MCKPTVVLRGLRSKSDFYVVLNLFIQGVLTHFWSAHAVVYLKYLWNEEISVKLDSPQDFPASRSYVPFSVLWCLAESNHRRSQFCEMSLASVYFGVSWSPSPKDIPEPSHSRIFREKFRSAYVVKGCLNYFIAWLDFHKYIYLLFHSTKCKFTSMGFLDILCKELTAKPEGKCD